MTVRPAARSAAHQRRPSVLRTALAAWAGAVVLLLVLGPAGAASASLGSVPAEVSSYVTGGAMVSRLSDVFGPNGKGNAGIDFDATTKPGPITRVYEWTDARLAGQKTDHPVQLTNNWAVPISVGGRVIGLATIWINPQTVQPELADFTQNAPLGTALTTVPATAALVRDLPTHAWLALAEGKVTPLVAGSSGLTTPAPVDSLKLARTSATPVARDAGPNTGLALAIGLVALIVVIILVALLRPRTRRAPNTTPDAAPAPAPSADPLPQAAVARRPEPEPETVAVPEPKPAAAKPAAPKAAAPKPRTAKPATAKPATAKPTTAKPATAKPATARPSGRTPTTSSAAKPAVSKPPASRKPTASKPATSKPPTPRQPPRPRTPKPPSTDSDS